MMVMVTVMQMLAMMLMIWDGGGETMATRATPPPPLFFCEARWATVPAGAIFFFARLRRVLHVSYLYGAPRH